MRLRSLGPKSTQPTTNHPKFGGPLVHYLSIVVAVKETAVRTAFPAHWILGVRPCVPIYVVPTVPSFRAFLLRALPALPTRPILIPTLAVRTLPFIPTFIS